jgi:acetyltransferase
MPQCRHERTGRNSLAFITSAQQVENARRKEVEIRSIQPEDEPLMIKFHQGLSERSVYMRYFESLSLASRTRHDRLAKVCIPKPGDETVLVAVRAGKHTGSNEIIGVARLSMLAASNSAEVAVLISDNSQGHGLGTELMRRLIDCARARKISRLSAEILRDNTVMQSIFRKLGFTLRQLEDPRTIKAVVEL